MDVLGGRHFVEIAGSKTHELPPLLVRASHDVNRLDRVMRMANQLIESEDIIPLPFEAADQESLLERRKMDLAVQIVEAYLGIVTQWNWGDSIIEWIRQCEMTFEQRLELRSLLRPDVWPHAGRSSFVLLLKDKAVDTGGVVPEDAVGMRLAFRQPPPLSCFSDQFLFYLKNSVAASAYQTWASMSPDPQAALPPERFCFEVHAI